MTTNPVPPAEPPAAAGAAAEITDPGLHVTSSGRAPALPRTMAWLRRFAKLWGFALFCLFIVYLFRDVALPFIFAILVAYVLAPVVDRMARVRLGGRALP